MSESAEQALTLDDIAERIELAVEGELDGLAIETSKAREIAAYALTGMAPSDFRDMAVKQCLNALARSAPRNAVAEQAAQEIALHENGIRRLEADLAARRDAIERWKQMAALATASSCVSGRVPPTAAAGPGRRGEG